MPFHASTVDFETLLIHTLDTFPTVTAVVHYAINFDEWVLTFEVELAHREREDAFRFENREFLADAVAWSFFERAPGVFMLLRFRKGVFIGEKAFGDKLERFGKVLFVAVNGVGDGPDIAAGERVDGAGLGVGEGFVAVWGRPAEGGGGWEDAEGFFEDGEAVGEGVDEVGGGFESGCCCGGGAEDGVEFGAQAGVDVWVGVEEVVAVGNGGARCIVAGEDEGLHLVDSGCAEGGIHGGGGFRGLRSGLEFLLICIKSEVDHGAFSVRYRLRFVGDAITISKLLVPAHQAFVKFCANEVVELSPVQPNLDWTEEIDAVKWINGSGWWHQEYLLPDDLVST